MIQYTVFTEHANLSGDLWYALTATHLYSIPIQFPTANWTQFPNLTKLHAVKLDLLKEDIKSSFKNVAYPQRCGWVVKAKPNLLKIGCRTFKRENAHLIYKQSGIKALASPKPAPVVKLAKAAKKRTRARRG